MRGVFFISNRMYQSYLKSYKTYLQIERAMSSNTILSYVGDVEKFLNFIIDNGNTPLTSLTHNEISDYLAFLVDNKISKTSQARTISSLRSFFNFLMIEKAIEINPMEIIELPKLGRYLPEVLSVEEVENILNSVDLSMPNGQRNRAILETLYSCGLRVSELVNLKISDIFFDEMFVRVLGKGSKERLVPIGKIAVKHINFYITGNRNSIKPKKGCEDYVFLNNRGGKLTREMIFIIVKEHAAKANVVKNVSPHTFRHSFATHLIQNGADIRIVQEMLGHESIMTTEIYTHIDKMHLKSVIDKYHPFNKMEH